jgi:hypothetical protein
MPCDRDDAAVRRLISHLEKVVLDLLAEYDREQQYDWHEHRARELVRQWLAQRPASTTKRGGQQ